MDYLIGLALGAVISVVSGIVDCVSDVSSFGKQHPGVFWALLILVVYVQGAHTRLKQLAVQADIELNDIRARLDDLE